MADTQAVSDFRAIRDAFRDGENNTAELTAQMLVAVREFLRQKESVVRLEEMTVHDIIALVDRPSLPSSTIQIEE